GTAQVYVDGVFRAAVDGYSGTRLRSAAIFDSGALPPGAHSLLIIVQGAKNAASRDSWVEVDGFRVVGTP
ncbi:MAG: hypothetical protein QOG80_2411, partial [Pseudonocardiales bacterium]|nr:hypothetical protein [Pseudonocardiales bacterium]